MSEEAKVSTPRAEVTEMQSRSAVCRALMSGTKGMRDQGKTYLPKWPLEDKEEWEARRDCTSLFPAFEDSVDAMVGKPLGEPVIVDGLPSEIEVDLQNVDLTGRDLDTYARDWFKRGLADGISWTVVDHPVVPEGATLATERAIGARPYLIHVPLSNVISWTATLEGGKHVLKEFRYSETVETQVGWGISTKVRIRVLKPGLVEVYEKNEKGEWALVPDLSGPTKKMDEVPVVAFAPGRTGYFVATPPLETLAWLNVTHWQSSSDQRNILHVARVPMRFGKCLKTTTEGQLAIGPSAMLMSDDKDGDFKYVEHTGKAIEAGRQDLQDLKEEMRLVAGKAMTRQAGGDKSATESANETRDGGSKLKQWTWSFQDACEEVLRLMCKWRGKVVSPTCTVNTDWDDLLDPTLFATVLQARVAGQVTRKTFLWNAKRFGAMDPERSIEDEEAELDAEGPDNFGTTNPLNEKKEA